MILEIGGGEDPRKDSNVRVDVRPIEGKVDVVADGLALPFVDGAFHKLYSRHAVEHFSHTDAETLFKEWSRVTGDEIEIHCPDLRCIAGLYLEGKLPTKQFVYLIYGAQDYPDNYHHSGYDAEYLIFILGEAGFTTFYHGDDPLDPYGMRFKARKNT